MNKFFGSMHKVALLLLLIMGGCRWLTGGGTPFFSMTSIKIPDGTPAFKQGFQDGCSSVVNARGNMLYRTKYKYRYDPKMIENTEYKFGHSRGWAWCFQNVLSESTGPQKSFDTYLMPYGNWGYDSSVGSINETGDGLIGGKGVWGDSVTTPGPGLNSMFDVFQKGGSGTTASVFGSNPLWAGGSKGHIFGWDYNGYDYGGE